MKTIFALILTMTIGIQLLSAQDQVTTAPAKNVTWNETTHDFGKVTLNNPATVTFTFKNTSDVPVVISAARPSCGCTVAEYTKEPVKPGESGEVKSTYNSARVGAFTKNVTVTFDGIQNPYTLTIKGEVEAKAEQPTQTEQPTK